MNTSPLVPRIEDLPYYTSPPIEFIYRQTASFTAGVYPWVSGPAAMIPNRPIMPNTIYYFRSLTLTADIEEQVFTANIVAVPQFQTYLKSRAGSPLFREAIYMGNFTQNFDYRLAWKTQQDADQLFASWNGTLGQNADLVGVGSITLTAVISAQEIVDDEFIALFKQKFPKEG